MAIRTGPNNPPLGCPRFDQAHDNPWLGVGTIVEGYDDTNNRVDEYIWLKTANAIANATEVTYDTGYNATAVGAGNGQATSIVAVGAGQYAWYRLKRRGVIA